MKRLLLLLCACAAPAPVDYGDPTARVEAPPPASAADTDAPVLDASVPLAVTPLGAIVVTGTVSDSQGIAALWIETIATPRVPIAVADTPGTHTFSSPVTLAVGDNTFAVVAEDLDGNRTRKELQARRTRVITLRSAPPENRTTTLRLDRAQLLDDALISQATRESIVLVEVPLRPIVKSALEVIAAGSYEPGTPEYNLSKLLGMTPDNANLSGSSVEEILEIAGGIGIPPERLLADLLLVAPTERVVDFDYAADALLEGLIGTHPNATRDGSDELVLRLTLDDVLRDMHPLKPRFGPSGAHPGFVPQDPDSVVESKVLLDGFAMEIPLTSHLRPYDGIDAIKGEKDVVYLLDGTSVLSFDFFSPEFKVVGIDDEPSLDIRITIDEAPMFFAAGTVNDGGHGNSAVWAQPAWKLERLVAELAYRQYKDAFTDPHDFVYFVYPSCPSPPCAGNEVARIGWDDGWLTFTASGIAVPPPQYAWDLLLEVAQIRLHDGGLAEGEGSAAFTLTDVPVGFSAETLIERTRPSLQAQEQQLSDAIAGSSGLVAPRAEVYFADGMLVSRLDGFYEDAARTIFIAPSIEASLGTRAYFADAEGGVHVIEIVEVTADGVALTLETP